MKKRRALHWVGTAFLVLGVLAFAWAFATWKWGDPVTSLYTGWKQRHLSTAYEAIADQYALPRKPVAAGRPKPEVVHVAATRFRKSAREGQAIGRIDVPKLDLDMVVVNGTDAASLKTGPGRDPRTFMPGEGELVYIAGHRTTYGAPFAHIDRLKTGDRVVLDLPYATFTYRVTRHVIVPATDVGRLKTTGVELLALQACHPRFSAKERYIVYARLVKLHPTERRRASTAASAASTT